MMLQTTNGTPGQPLRRRLTEISMCETGGHQLCASALNAGQPSAAGLAERDQRRLFKPYVFLEPLVSTAC